MIAFLMLKYITSRGMPCVLENYCKRYIKIIYTKIQPRRGPSKYPLIRKLFVTFCFHTCSHKMKTQTAQNPKLDFWPISSDAP